MQQNGESYYSQLLLAPTECHETDLYDSTNHNLEAAFPELFWVVFFWILSLEWRNPLQVF